MTERVGEQVDESERNKRRWGGQLKRLRWKRFDDPLSKRIYVRRTTDSDFDHSKVSVCARKQQYVCRKDAIFFFTS